MSKSTIRASTTRFRTAHSRASHPVWRAVGVAGLIGIATIHLADLSSKMSETPYLGWMYIGLIVTCAATAGALVWTSQHRLAWIIAGGLSAATLAGYCLSRTTGLPGATDDIGNWGETLGVVSLFVEATVVGIALSRLRPAPSFSPSR